MAYPVEIVHSVRIPVGPPGLSLGGVLYRPRTSIPVPAVVVLMPYRVDALGGAALRPMLRHWAGNGYAALMVDLRGMGSSDGVALPPFDPANADDGEVVLRWVADQSWCSGAVGLWGFSYGAALAVLTATRRPEPLRAVVSVMGMLDGERDFVHPGGTPGLLAPLGVWGLGTLANQLLPPIDDRDEPAQQQRWRERAERSEPYLVDLYRHPPGHPVWRARAIDASTVDIPMLSVGGWRDPFIDATVRLYEQVRGPRRLVVGPWPHVLPDGAPDEPVDLGELTRRWWDRWLGRRDRDTDEAEVTLHLPGAAGWRGFGGWPPPAARRRHVADPDGGLTAGQAAPTTLSTVDDPTAGALSGLWGIPHGGYGRPLDQHDDDLRGLAVTGPPLPEPLVILGRPSVSLTTVGEVERLVVLLADVDGLGRSSLVTGGIGAPAGTVWLDPAGYEVAAGHRLRVVVRTAAFPRLWPSGPDGGDGVLRLRGLALEVPVVDAGAGKPSSPERPQPAPGPSTRDTPVWTIVREPVLDRLSVTVGGDVGMTLDSGHEFSLDTRLTVTVQRDAPAAAHLLGRQQATVRLTDGTALTVRVDLRLTRAGGVATGEVRHDATTLLRRQWTVSGPA